MDEDVHGKTLGDVLLKVGGTCEILAELWEASVELADELTVFGASCLSRVTPEVSQIVDEPCCLEVPAVWKKSIPQFSSYVRHFKLRE
jgi:hypothetical protein